MEILRIIQEFITVDKKLIRLGSFFTKEEAVAARKAAEKEHFGEYAYDASIAAVPRIEIDPAS